MMDSFETYDDIPWDLILPSLQGQLPKEEDWQLQQWLSRAETNQSRYGRLRRIWVEEMADYALYRQADEEVAWQALEKKMGSRNRIIPLSFAGRRWVAVAAALLLTAGAGYWYFSGKANTIVYATTGKEKKTISLPDGSTIILSPQTHIQLDDGYSKDHRTVTLTDGEATFDVHHQGSLPFTVNMDIVSVKDIATSFTIQRGKDSIKVMVSEGKVAFINNGSGETRDIPAGMSLSFSVGGRRFGTITSKSADNDSSLLKFSNMALSNVISVMQKVYGRSIRLEDTTLGKRWFTADLNGESFENAMKIICASFNLTYEMKGGTGVLKRRHKPASH